MTVLKRGSRRVLVACSIVSLLGIAAADAEDGDVLASLRLEVVPEAGRETAYGVPLSLASLPRSIGWWETLVPAVEGDARFRGALLGLVAPCCDDNTALSCCCEQGGRSCNIIRSGKGLTACLIIEHGFDMADVQASVLEWLRFARPPSPPSTSVSAVDGLPFSV